MRVVSGVDECVLSRVLGGRAELEKRRTHRVDKETFLSRDIVRSHDRVNASNARARLMLSFQPV